MNAFDESHKARNDAIHTELAGIPGPVNNASGTAVHGRARLPRNLVAAVYDRRTIVRDNSPLESSKLHPIYWGSLAQCTTFCGWCLQPSRLGLGRLRERNQPQQVVRCATEHPTNWRRLLAPFIPSVRCVPSVPSRFLGSVALPSTTDALPPWRVFGIQPPTNSGQWKARNWQKRVSLVLSAYLSFPA